MTRKQKIWLFGGVGILAILLFSRRRDVQEVASSAAESVKKFAFGAADPTEKNIVTLADEMQPIARRFVEQARAAGFPVVITSGRRTMAEQAALYAKGRTSPGGIVTNAQPGDSAHNFGLAFDFAFGDAIGRPTWPKDAPWAQVAEIGKQLGMTWGGDWKSFVDQPHFELPSWRVARAEYKATGRVTA